jgi:hypothetical protein
MADKQIRRLPVCQDGELVGMLSIGDLAVKTPRMDASAEALREISYGVKGDNDAAPVSTSRLGERGHEGGSRAPHALPADFSDDEDFDLEFSDEKDMAARSAPRERHTNRHHTTPKMAKGSNVSQSQPQPISEGQAQSVSNSRAGKNAQGITTKKPQEDARRKRVVSIRDEGQPSKSRTRKTG